MGPYVARQKRECKIESFPKSVGISIGKERIRAFAFIKHRELIVVGRMRLARAATFEANAYQSGNAVLDAPGPLACRKLVALLT